MAVEATQDGDVAAENKGLQLTGGQKFMKIVIVALSVLYLIFGCVLCAVGSYAVTGSAASLTGTSLPKGLIAIGAFLIVTSLLGVVASIKEIRLGLLVFFVLMLLWSIILIAIGIAVYAEQNEINVLVSKAWNALDDQDRIGLQNSFDCCYGFSNSSGSVPDTSSCASVNVPNVPGCVPTISQIVQDNLSTAGSCGIAFACVMFVGLAFTCFLMKGIQSKGYAEAIARNRAREEKDREARRQRGKGGLRIPDNVL